MAHEFIYTMQRVSRVHPPDKQVLADISLSFYPGAKIGVLGSNGAGKSSLLRIMAGLDDGYSGEARLTKGFSVGFLQQEPQLDARKDVAGNVADGVGETMALLKQFNDVCEAMGDPDADFDVLLEKQGKLQDQIDAIHGWDVERTLDIAMDALRLPPGDSPVTHLSGGERRRVALCRLLLQRPDLLLLDEPTNHLDADSVAWLERFLKDYEGTVIAVTHDRYFLDNVAGWILELDRGRGIPWQGNYSSWLEQKHARLAQEEKADKVREQTLARELEWMRMAPKARHAKGQARVNAYEQLVAEAEAADDKQQRVEIAIPAGPRLGDVVVEAKNVSKAYGDKLLIEDLTFSLPRGGIVGVIGANGAGKTTLFKMITGAEKPDSGEFTVGATVEIAHVDQSRETLNADKTVFEEISDGLDHMVIGGREYRSRAWVAGFGFTGTDQQKVVGTLSGGERNRVQLAKVLRAGGNLILLDEPTNDLDVDTLRALEEGLLSFPGCAVVISHDRWFLDRIATHMLAFEGDSQVVWFEGNYQDYEADRKQRLGGDAAQPHRIKYKPLVRN
jgi:ATP-binding cassette ChvD family protein